MKINEESEKVVLKLNISKTKIMASGPIASWEIDGETVETVSDFIFLGSKITADGNCSLKSESEVAQSLSRIQLFDTPWTAAYQAPPSMGFSRQEYWSVAIAFSV